MLKFATPSREKILYKALIIQGNIDQALVVACDSIPSDVIPNLPKDILKNILADYPVEEKTKLLLSMDDEKRELFLDSIGEVGSANREMIDLELETIGYDEGKSKVIKSQSNKLWVGFVSHSRAFLKDHNEYFSQVKDSIKLYFESLKS